MFYKVLTMDGTFPICVLYYRVLDLNYFCVFKQK